MAMQVTSTLFLRTDMELTWATTAAHMQTWARIANTTLIRGPFFLKEKPEGYKESHGGKLMNYKLEHMAINTSLN